MSQAILVHFPALSRFSLRFKSHTSRTPHDVMGKKVDKTKVADLDSKTKAVFLRKGYKVETMLGAGSYGEVRELFWGFLLELDDILFQNCVS